jgi:hypothetical protein
MKQIARRREDPGEVLGRSSEVAAQVRAAGALLNWSKAEPAARAGLSRASPAIARFARLRKRQGVHPARILQALCKRSVVTAYNRSLDRLVNRFKAEKVSYAFDDIAAYGKEAMLIEVFVTVNRRMPVIAFPDLLLSPQDEAAIVAEAQAGGYYCCKRIVNEAGQPVIELLNRDGVVRGRIGKRGGFYIAVDSHNHVVAEGKNLKQVLSILSK